MDYQHIIEKLPYDEPFLFVDKISQLNEEGIVGSFTFRPDLDFYQGHFKDNPVTPGVILTECCAQIGLACLGIYLMKGETDNGMMALSSSEMEFFLPVFPGDTIEVRSNKIFFRFGKLKCNVRRRQQFAP